MFLCSADLKVCNFYYENSFVFLVVPEKCILFLLCGCFIFIFSSIQYCFQFEFIALDIGFIASEIYLVKHYFEKSILNPFLVL